MRSCTTRLFFIRCHPRHCLQRAGRSGTEAQARRLTWPFTARPTAPRQTPQPSDGPQTAQALTGRAASDPALEPTSRDPRPCDPGLSLLTGRRVEPHAVVVSRVMIVGDAGGDAKESASLRDAARAWILYDAAYSTFAFLFITRYFPAWIVNDLHQPDWLVSAGLSSAVAVVVLVAPAAGRLADRHRLRRQLLRAFTIASCLFAATLTFASTKHPALLVAVASASIMFGQLAVAQFDPLIAYVADGDRRGRVSGLGVGFGFLGSLVGLAVLTIALGSSSKQYAFLPLAVAYLLIALPALNIDDSSPAPSRGLERSPTATVRLADARRFVWARFFYCEAILTASGYMTVFMARVGGFSDTLQSVVLGLAVVTAGAGSIAAGYCMRRWSPIDLIVACLPVTVACLALLSVAPARWSVFVAAPSLGACLGVFWSSDRVFLISLIPAQSRGEWFAYFNLANRLATAVGPFFIWGGSVWLLTTQLGWLTALGANRVALLALSGLALLGLAVAVPLRTAGNSTSQLDPPG